MGHQHGRNPYFALEMGDGVSHLGPERRFQAAEGLVEQQQLGADDESASQRHPLLLPATQLVGPSILEAGELHGSECIADPCSPILSICLSHTEPELNVLAYRSEREKSVLLEHHDDSSPLRGDVQHRLAVEQNISGGRANKTGDETQSGGLSAA